MLTMDHAEAPYLANLDLPLYGLALVIGAYKGDTIAFLRDQYQERDLRVVGFEPQLWAAEECVQRFQNDPYVEVIPCGLWTKEKKLPLYEYQTDACSVMPLPDSRQKGEGHFYEAHYILDELPARPNLTILNCEGAEFTLVPYIADRIRGGVVFVQVHTYWGDADQITACFPEKAVIDIGAGWYQYA